MNIDPRLSVISDRLSGIGRILAVTGGKGGVGKSVTSSGLALALSAAGRKVGLLDLDLSGPSQHVILGARGVFPEEERGIVPPEVAGIRFLSLVMFTGEQPSPLRGSDISNAIIELLAITQWGKLDVLIVDMPPGLSDAALDVLRLMRRAESVLVTVPSKVAFATVEKTIRMFQELHAGMIGVLENMRMPSSALFVERECARLKVPFLGAVPFDERLEAAIGAPAELNKTDYVRSLAAIASREGLPGWG
ncbi:MAG: P-loop NTPase [Elusimicrobiota bacterium]